MFVSESQSREEIHEGTLPQSCSSLEVTGMKTVELRKQISIFIPLSDWRAIREEAARQRIPMTELCRRWMNPDLERLRNQPREEPRRSR